MLSLVAVRLSNRSRHLVEPVRQNDRWGSGDISASDRKIEDRKMKSSTIFLSSIFLSDTLVAPRADPLAGELPRGKGGPLSHSILPTQEQAEAEQQQGGRQRKQGGDRDPQAL